MRRVVKKYLKLIRDVFEIRCRKKAGRRFKINAHALGVYNGMTYTNCKEAYINSRHKGIRHFEADISVTKDGEYVLSHEFDYVHTITAEQFISSTEMGTRLTLHDMFDLIEGNQDIEVMFDFLPGFYERGDSEEIYRFVSRFAQKDWRDRCLIEVYSIGQMAAAKAAGMDHLQMYVELPHPLHKELSKIEDYIDVLGQYHVDRVSVPAAVISENPDVVKKLHDRGFIIYSSGWGSCCRLFLTPNTKYIDYLTTDLI